MPKKSKVKHIFLISILINFKRLKKPIGTDKLIKVDKSNQILLGDLHFQSFRVCGTFFIFL